MRYRLVFWVCLAWIAVCGNAAADVVIQGTVASVDRAGGRLAILQDGTLKAIHVVIPPRRLPSSVSAGSRVRVWGTFPKNRKDVLRANGIAPVRSKAGTGDPTGVRSRLFKGLK